MLIDNALWYS